MPDFSKLINKFDGESGPITAKQWLEEIITFSLLHNWSPAFTYQMATINLIGAGNIGYRQNSLKLLAGKSLREYLRRLLFLNQA